MNRTQTFAAKLSLKFPKRRTSLAQVPGDTFLVFTDQDVTLTFNLDSPKLPAKLARLVPVAYGTRFVSRAPLTAFVPFATLAVAMLPTLHADGVATITPSPEV